MSLIHSSEVEPCSCLAIHYGICYEQRGCRETLPPPETHLTWRLGQRGREAGEVDERVGHEEEVGDDGCNGIQFTWNDRDGR